MAIRRGVAIHIIRLDRDEEDATGYVWELRSAAHGEVIAWQTSEPYRFEVDAWNAGAAIAWQARATWN